MRTFLNTFGLIVIMVLILTFAMQNNAKVKLNYYFGAYDCYILVLVLIPFFIGVIAGNLLDVIQRFRLKKEIRNLQKQLNMEH